MVKTHYDVVIVGGGVIGSAIAYFLAADPLFPGTILVVERDRSYRRCSTALSVGGFRQQFSTPENIKIAQFSADFLLRIGAFLSVEDEAPAVDFVQGGYLFLATPSGLATLKQNIQVQHANGSPTQLLDTEQLRQKFPWLHTQDLAAGGFGATAEGWLDPYSLLQAFARKAVSLGVTYLQDEVVGINHRQGKLLGFNLKRSGSVHTGIGVNAAGPQSRDLAGMAGLDLPIHCRKRSVFAFRCAEPIDQVPLLIDPSGVYVRPEGEGFLCGTSPPEDQDPDCCDFRVQDELFEEIIWPALAHRIPAFEQLKRTSSWAGHYAFNVKDQNAVLGPHPQMTNLILANGFSGHGLQQSPAVGRAIAEWIIHGAYQTLDLGRFSYTRFNQGRLLIEQNVV